MNSIATVVGSAPTKLAMERMALKFKSPQIAGAQLVLFLTLIATLSSAPPLSLVFFLLLPQVALLLYSFRSSKGAVQVAPTVEIRAEQKNELAEVCKQRGKSTEEDMDEIIRLLQLLRLDDGGDEKKDVVNLAPTTLEPKIEPMDKEMSLAKRMGTPVSSAKRPAPSFRVFADGENAVQSPNSLPQHLRHAGRTPFQPRRLDNNQQKQQQQEGGSAQTKKSANLFQTRTETLTTTATLGGE